VGEDAEARLAQSWGYLYTQRLQASAQRLPDDDAGSGEQAEPPPGRLTALPGDLRCAWGGKSMAKRVFWLRLHGFPLFHCST